jgi:hypothetical protein
MISTLYDGTVAKLFVNGQQECSVTPGTTYSPTVANTVVGSNPGRTSNFWTGLLSSLKIFGTSDSTAPISSTSALADFNAEANRYRIAPTEYIATQGLVLNLDAANANQGIAPFTNGCANSDSSWFDLAFNFFGITLVNFASCGSTSGWVGDGTLSNPYSIAFDGTNDFVDFATKQGNYDDSGLTDSTDSTFSFTFWANPSGVIAGTAPFTKTTTGTVACSTTQGILGSRASSPNSGVEIALGTNGVSISEHSATFAPVVSAYNDSISGWTHIAVVSSSAADMKLYVNGVLKDTATQTARARILKSHFLGKKFSCGMNYFIGKLAIFQAYNRALSLEELKRNCLAQEGRFTSTAQSICAAP